MTQSTEIDIKVGDELDPQGFGECPWCKDDGDLDSESSSHETYYYFCNNCEGEIQIRIAHVVYGLEPPK